MAASNRFYLVKLGVTHVLNAAEGKREKSGTVDTNKEYYEPWGITYKGDLSYVFVGVTKKMCIHKNDVLRLMHYDLHFKLTNLT